MEGRSSVQDVIDGSIDNSNLVCVICVTAVTAHCMNCRFGASREVISIGKGRERNCRFRTSREVISIEKGLRISEGRS